MIEPATFNMLEFHVSKKEVLYRGVCFYLSLWQVFKKNCNSWQGFLGNGEPSLCSLIIFSCKSGTRSCLLFKPRAFEEIFIVLASWKKTSYWKISTWLNHAVYFPYKTELYLTHIATLVASIAFITAVNFICSKCAGFHTYGRHLQLNITAKHNGAN